MEECVREIRHSTPLAFFGGPKTVMVPRALGVLRHYRKDLWGICGERAK